MEKLLETSIVSRQAASHRGIAVAGAIHERNPEKRSA
jgi:hypothetical protein